MIKRKGKDKGKGKRKRTNKWKFNMMKMKSSKGNWTGRKQIYSSPLLSLEYPERIQRGLEWTQFLKRLCVCLFVLWLSVSKFSHFLYYKVLGQAEKGQLFLHLFLKYIYAYVNKSILKLNICVRLSVCLSDSIPMFDLYYRL